MMKEEQNTSWNNPIEIISLSSQIKTPTFNIDSNDKYIHFGENNDIPTLLNKFAITTPMHSAILERKVHMTLAGGLLGENGDTLTDNPNPFESWNDLALKIITDWWIFGGAWLQVAWERGGDKPKEFFHKDYVNIRLEVPNEFGIIEKAYENKRQKDPTYAWDSFSTLSDMVSYPLFNGKTKDKLQLLYIKSPNTNSHYSLPDYFSSLKDLDTLAEISTFHNANIHNNMQPGFKFIFEGAIPPEDEKSRIIKETMKKYRSASNTGNAMFFFTPENGKLTAEPIAVSDVSKMYNLLAQDVKENILVAHQMPRKVAGIETKSGLGSSKEVIESLELFKESVIKPNQQIILRYLSALLGQELSFKDIEPNLLLGFDMTDLKAVLTQNEIRELMGYEPIAEIENKQELSMIKKLLKW